MTDEQERDQSMVHIIESAAELAYAFRHCKAGNIFNVDHQIFRLLADDCGTVQLHIVEVDWPYIEFKTVWPDLHFGPFRGGVQTDDNQWFSELEEELRWQLHKALGSRQHWQCGCCGKKITPKMEFVVDDGEYVMEGVSRRIWRNKWLVLSEECFGDEVMVEVDPDD